MTEMGQQAHTIFAAGGETCGATLRGSSAGDAGKHPVPSKWVWEFLSTPSAWEELEHRKSQSGRCMLEVSCLLRLNQNV